MFELQQAGEAYDFCQKQIGECDVQLQKHLAALPDRVIGPPQSAGGAGDPNQGNPNQNSKQKKSQGRKSQRNHPPFDLEAELTRICGVNLKSIDGVDVMTIATFLSEVGTDMPRWRTEDHWVSWLKLAPCRQVSGGWVIKHERMKTKNRVSGALRMAASSLIHSQSYLGARFRHLRSRLGPGKAIFCLSGCLSKPQ